MFSITHLHPHHLLDVDVDGVSLVFPQHEVRDEECRGGGWGGDGARAVEGAPDVGLVHADGAGEPPLSAAAGIEAGKGRPQQNGRHERIHLTLKQETTRPPGANALQQQDRFDAFISEFNRERPHEALDMKTPEEVYTPSSRNYRGLPEVDYPFHDKDILVTACGRVCMYRKKINVSTLMAGQRLGIKEVEDGIWLLSFMHYDLGYIDLEQRTLQTIDNPFGTRLSPMS